MDNRSLLDEREIATVVDGVVNTSLEQGNQAPQAPEEVIDTMARIALAAELADREKEVFKVSRDPDTYEVNVESDITLADYERITPPADFLLLKQWAREVEGKTITFINPTMEGGGVAMLRPPLVHLMRQLGVDAHWFVMDDRKESGKPSPFDFTKLMHNISQRRAGDKRISDTGKYIHQEWNAENAEVLTRQDAIVNADIVVLDDPQPAPLKRYIEAVNPDVKFVWRNHIDTDRDLMADPTTPQGEVAKYLLEDCGIRNVHAAIAHPVGQFVHRELADVTYFAPATIEPHDDLNRHLTDEEVRQGIDFINSEIAIKNAELEALGRTEDLQSPVDTDRGRIILVARFDESKGMDKAMALGVRVRQQMRDAGVAEEELPQVIIIGNGSVDDPSGIPMYEKMLQLRRENYPNEKQDIVMMRLKHNYVAMNAVMQRTPRSDGREPAPVVGMQTSDAEGCETRISDWIRHGIPVVVSNRGGMSLQVVEGRSGIVMDYDKPDYDIERGAQYMTDLLTNPTRYAEVSRATFEEATNFNNRDFTTIANATRLLRVFDGVLKGRKADRTWKVSEMPAPVMN